MSEMVVILHSKSYEFSDRGASAGCRAECRIATEITNCHKGFLRSFCMSMDLRLYQKKEGRKDFD